MDNIATWFLMFIIYASAGWIIEVCVGIGLRHKVSNRGFLIGPICPIYGVGALLLSLVLHGPEKNLLSIFCIGLVGGVTLEYLTSVIMEKLFHVRWWDYSKMPFNLNGRICLQSAILFGVGAIIINEATNPFLLHLLGILNPTLRLWLAIFLFILLVADFITSFFLIRSFKITVGNVSQDSTDEISARVHEILMDRGKLSRRLVKAFPDFEAKEKTTKNTNHSPKNHS